MKHDEDHIKHSLLVKPVLTVEVPPILGLVLAGGESRRMGQDKGSISYHAIPQREYMLQLLGHLVSQCYLSCRHDSRPETTSPVIEDTFLDLGPFGGVISAFRFNPNVAWLTVACDMPLLDEETIAYLIEQRDPTKMATCFLDPSTELPEPLLTIWEPTGYPKLLQFLSQGISCLRKSLINSDVKIIEAPIPAVLKNANTPEEARKMKELLHSNDL